MFSKSCHFSSISYYFLEVSFCQLNREILNDNDTKTSVCFGTPHKIHSNRQSLIAKSNIFVVIAKNGKSEKLANQQISESDFDFSEFPSFAIMTKMLCLTIVG